MITATEALRLFDERAQSVIRSTAGGKSSKTATAIVLGISRSAYSKALTNAQGLGTWNTLFDWLGRWRAAGMPELGILGTLAERWGGA